MAPAAIELVLEPDAAGSLLRLPGMAAAGPAGPVTVSWHDTADGALAADGLSLALQGTHWVLEGLRAPAALLSPPVLRREDRREVLGGAVPAATAPLATLSGTRRALRWRGAGGEASLALLQGRLEGGPALCRVSAEGPVPVLLALAGALAAIHAAVPRASLAAEAIAGATGRVVPPRALGAPTVCPGQDVGDALPLVLGHLADAMLHWADRVPAAAAAGDPEPVHQMRVATRRLRSALSVFRRGVPSPALAVLGPPMKDCAARLGEARDWDVFLRGTGAALAAAFPDDPRCAALLRAGGRARRAAHDRLCGFLAGPEFRALSVALAAAAALRPWEAEGCEGLGEGLAAFGAASLARRFRHVRRAGHAIEALPVPALHALRKDCKRLRYTAEFFAPLFPAHPVRRFVRRLAALQDELGLLNDGAAVPGLLAQLGRLERGHAAGVVRGLAAGQAVAGRAHVAARWRRFRAAEPFWAG